MSQQCCVHGMVDVTMLGAHGKQMRTTESSAVHNKAKALDNNALGARMTRCCVRDRRTWVHATCHDRLVQLQKKKKKKKRKKKVTPRIGLSHEFCHLNSQCENL